MPSHLILGTILIIFSLAFYQQTTALDSRSAMFPQFVLLGLGITGSLMILQALLMIRKYSTTGHKKIDHQANRQFIDTLLFQILVPGGMLLVTFGILIAAGFYFAAPLLVFSVYGYHAYRINKTALTRSVLIRGAIFAVIITSLMYVIFTLLLGLPAPSGAFF